MMPTCLSICIAVLLSYSFAILKSRKQVVKKSSYQYFKKTIFQYCTKKTHRSGNAQRQGAGPPVPTSEKDACLSNFSFIGNTTSECFSNKVQSCWDKSQQL